ncbi:MULTISPECIES: hypothetical protein [unclassified Spirosoma]|uniref:hypothetical protein n=1 Tax=unclassified Spirosoma TaxID=2621999 RepID=UPI000962471F|nr:MULTISPECIES: hypothetical protein [unclassified Spirosoma]MBN8823524.1 hypothetical protein [Spirosoma sp.]OJW71867.1 MAG: hypothetical protein BGO59_16615 [Spirosoma sp. 48-14]
MTFKKLFTIVTPLMGMALLGLIMIGYGFVHPSQQNNVLQFIFGIPIALGAIGAHFLILRIVHNNTLIMWIIEAVIVGFLCYAFPKM